MGTIYWEETSRGTKCGKPDKRGRWVAQRMEGGKRVRMRSADYHKVLNWLNGYNPEQNRKQLKGFPNYSVDTERQEVYNRWGRLMKGAMRKGQREYQLSNADGAFRITSYRIMYAAIHNIDVRKIPTDIIVTFSDGEYTLQYRGDFISGVRDRSRARNMKFIEDSLKKRRKEIDILLRFYRTGESAELVQYATKDIFSHLIEHLVSIRHCTIDRATNIVLEATELFLSNALTREKPYTSISSSIISLCRMSMAQTGKRRELAPALL